MKKILFLLALVAVMCGQAQAQLMAVADNANDFNISSELSLSNTVNHSLYSPTLLNNNSVFGTNATMDLQSTQGNPVVRKIFGIGLIVSGSSAIVVGGAFAAIALIGKNLSQDDIENLNPIPDPPAAKDEPSDPFEDMTFDEGKDMVTNIMLYTGIGVAVAGAGMLTGGIILVSSDGSKGSSASSSNSYVNKNTRNTPESKKYKHKRRTAELLLDPTDAQIAPAPATLGWNLVLNSTTTGGTLTFNF